jgi:outer membrane biosynthesis protein TonB
MSRYSRSIAPLALTLALFAGACKENKKENALTQDTTLSRDLELANRDTASQPQLKDVPDTSATKPESTPVAEAKSPPRPTPRPAPKRTTTSTARTPSPSAAPTPAPAPTPKPTTTPSGNTVDTARAHEGALATVAAGTMINLTSNDRVCTNTAHAGDRFTATVKDPVTGSNGAVIPAGATAVVQVTSVSKSDNANDPVKMGFVVQTININGKSYPVDASIVDAKVEQVRSKGSKSSDTKKVIGGAVAGAIIGQVLGKDTKSTVIGAATGAAAGTAVAMATGDYEGCVPTGGRITIKLNSPATVQAN